MSFYLGMFCHPPVFNDAVDLAGMYIETICSNRKNPVVERINDGECTITETMCNIKIVGLDFFICVIESPHRKSIFWRYPKRDVSLFFISPSKMFFDEFAGTILPKRVTEEKEDSFIFDSSHLVFLQPIGPKRLIDDFLTDSEIALSLREDEFIENNIFVLPFIDLAYVCQKKINRNLACLASVIHSHLGKVY